MAGIQSRLKHLGLLVLVVCAKPATLANLKAFVEDVAATVPAEIIRDAVGNLRKRCRACMLADRGHFESFL